MPLRHPPQPFLLLPASEAGKKIIEMVVSVEAGWGLPGFYGGSGCTSVSALQQGEEPGEGSPGSSGCGARLLRPWYAGNQVG